MIMRTTFRLMLQLIVVLSTQGCSPTCSLPDQQSDRIPQLFPDYTDVTFPVNIAPPNFIIREEGDAYQTEIGFGDKIEICYTDTDPEVIIPVKKWKNLLKQAAGKPIFIRITIRKEGVWTQYATIYNTISVEPIDSHIAYRLLYPGYELWNEMGIYQRDLTSYEETPILENSSIEKQCINCHTFNQNSPENMMLHIRGKAGGTLIRHNGTTLKRTIKPTGSDNSGTYAAWHPSGKYIAFSVNEIQQYFHLTGKKPVEVSDLAADLIVYDVAKDRIISDSTIYGSTYMETFPNWSPDGKTLYFCRANRWKQGIPLDSVRYGLYRIGFDPQTELFGLPECLYDAEQQGKSISFPRVSPDGQYLMFTVSNYGNFSIWHPESELYILTLTTGKIRRMEEVNSDNVESYHTWSSSGHWFVFSSKRLDGLWARPFFAYFNSQTGKAGKPFLLPQKDPHFYDNFTKTFNLPELVKGSIQRIKTPI